jgi:hypothetical protein
MSHSLFEEGGPHDIKKIGPEEYTMHVSIPSGERGRTARECPNANCSPGYFKVKGRTGIVEGQKSAFCPYCRTESEPGDFTTKEQARYAQDVLLSEVDEGITNMIKETLGLDSSGRKSYGGGLVSMELSLKPAPKQEPRRPFEEELRRDVTCPYCTLDQSVYGLATWCAYCGNDIFLTNVESELIVVRAMLGDINRRRELLGARVAAKDLENCLEDTVSIFEAVLKALTSRFLRQSGKPENEVETFFRKIGNSFQSIRRSNEVLQTELGMSLSAKEPKDETNELSQIFEKRHAITHNLGIVDKKYLEKVRTAEKEGREVLVSTEEIAKAIDLSSAIFRSLHLRMFGPIS